MNFMRRIKITLLFLIALVQGYSQYNSTGGAIGINLGYSYLDTKSINEILPSHFQLDNNYLTIGGDGYGMIKRYVFGGSGYALFGPGASTDSSIVSFNGGAGFLNFGYAAFNKPRFKFIPILGIGGAGMSLHVSQYKDITLQDIQNQPLNETELTWSNFVFEIGFNLEYIIKKTDNDLSKGLRIGLKAGYTFSPASNKWKYVGGSVTGLPKFMMNGFYARLVIGGAFFSNKKIKKK
jgi:hypothetical protein